MDYAAYSDEETQVTFRSWIALVISVVCITLVGEVPLAPIDRWRTSTMT